MTNKQVLTVFLVFMTVLLSAIPDLKASEQHQPNRNVTGKVVSIDDQPLEGVSIRIKGKNRETVTNALGTFNLSNVAPNDVLTIAYVGYITQEIPLKGKREVNITLIHSLEQLEEVVVVGYGTIAKSDYTGSSSRVDLEGVENNRYVSALEALQGRLAGVQINNNTGEPGSGLTFNIRGVSSVSGSGQPLIVVDGQPIESSFGSTQAGMGLEGGMDISPIDPLAGLNPADIESIEVLKDVSSMAIYGSRAANGVVLITTKSGKLGRDKITFSSRGDYNTMPKYLDVLNAREYMAFVNEARVNSNLAPRYDERAIDSISAIKDFDWQRAILKNGFSHNQQLVVSGRDDRNNYLISGNYTDQNSLIQNAGFKRYGIRLNYERKITNKLTFGIRSNLSLMDRKYGQQSNWTGITGSNAVRGAMMYSPIQSAYDDDGEVDMDFVNNPVIVTTLVKDDTKIRSIILNATLSYSFNKYLKYTLRAGANDMYSLRQIYHPKGTFLGNSAPNGVAVRADNANTNYLIDNLLNYNRTFARKHRVHAVTGFSYQYWENRASSVTNRDFPSDVLGYENFQSANAPGVMQTIYRQRALESVLGRVNYAYDRRYLLTLTGRADGTSRLADGHKWGFFYSAGLGWNLHSEKFFPEKLDFINNLKLRASYGISGMENVAIGATQAIYQLNHVNIGSSILPSYTQADFDIPSLGWESTSQFNGGIDVGLAKNRYQFSIDFYHKRTTDLLFNLPLPPSSTYANMYTNMGEIVNKGIDFEGQGNLLNKRNLKIDMGVNFSVLRNKIVNMGSLSAVYGGSYMSGGSILLGQPVHAAIPGYSIPSFWGYKTNGIYQNQAEIDNDPALANDASRSAVTPGMIKYVDINGDGQITDSDKTIIGNPFPDFTYGFNMNLSYKKFSLGMVFMGSQGNQLLNLNSWVLEANNTTGGFTSTRRAYEGAWRGEGTGNLYPAISMASVRMNQRFPDWMVEDASYFRMQSLTMGYTFKLPKSMGPASSVRAYLSGTNLFTITKYSGYDPAINAFGSSLLNAGLDMGTLPQPRTYSIGFELSF